MKVRLTLFVWNVLLQNDVWQESIMSYHENHETSFFGLCSNFLSKYVFQINCAAPSYGAFYFYLTIIIMKKGFSSVPE